MDASPTTSTPPLFTKHVLRAVDLGTTRITEAPADPDRDVHCAALSTRTKGGTRKEFATVRRYAMVRVMTVPGFFWIGMIITIALTVSGMLLRPLGAVVSVVSALLIGSLAIPAALWMKRRGAPKAPKEAKALLAKASDERFRLRLISSARLAWSLRELSNQPFEPRVFPILFCVPARRWIVVTSWLLCSAALFAAWWWLKRRMDLGTFLAGGPPKAWEIWAIMAGAATPFAWAWPAYIRISPGKFDVFRYPFMGAGRPRVDTFDVRQAKISCQAHFEDGYILIEVPGQEPKSIQLNRWGAKFHEVFKATFEAARWRGDLLTLPDDELVG